MIKILIGGSPCTFWSIAQKNNRETEASGIGWELFKNYKIALDKYKPDYFLYENNKSAAQAIKDQICKELNVVEPDLLTPDNGIRMTHINSALVSAQNRQRFYVTNFGDIEQPEDRGILLKDVLGRGYDLTANDKAYAQTASYNGACAWNTIERHQRNMVAEPVRVGCMPSPDGTIKNAQANRVYSVDGKSVNQVANGGGSGAKTGLYAVPVRIGTMPQSNGEAKDHQDSRIYSIDGKSPATISSGAAKTGLYAIPVNATKDGKASTMMAGYYKYGLATVMTNKGFKGGANAVAEPVNPLKSGKARCVTAGYYAKSKNEIVECHYSENPNKQKWDGVAEPIPCYAQPCEWDENGVPTKAISCADGKTYTVYEVSDGQITIKGKRYPIKLIDGYYIIRKLTVRECARLQTIPEWVEFPVSDTQAYKQIGNGWTIEVIKFLLEHIPNIHNEEIEILSMYDGMSCGQIALKDMGCNVVRYFASEIDKYAIETTMHNFPNTIQLGDAFQVREDNFMDKLESLRSKI